MPQRLKFIVAYDGAPFAGWQSQAGGNTVQDILEEAFAAVSGEHLRVHGAGRTDAGVHALGQCAHVEVAGRTLAAERWPLALNGNLPPTIRVLQAAYKPATFHARFSARGKIYRYRIWNDRVLPPLELGRAWQVPQPMDFALTEAAARQFVGRHDFAAFAANRGRPEESTVRTIGGVRVRRRGKCIELEFSGDGFLYKMVRLMVGAIVRCAIGRSSPREIRQMLARPGEAPPGTRLVAPAEGLFLLRVRY